MYNFEYYNPVKIMFGKETIGHLPVLLSNRNKILFAYGSGSIKNNGIYEQVKQALAHKQVIEFQGIEPNPEYETLLKAVDVCKKNNIDFILAVGGGSVIDGCKFIAHAVKFKKSDPWLILEGAETDGALPIGCILTLPATGSEMNSFAVISRRKLEQKKDFASTHSFPQFSIIDPTVTFSLSDRYIINGIIDPFVHVTEQYLTFDVNSPLQNRQSEAILITLIEEAAKVFKDPNNYEIRANLTWCATQALNGLIGKGVPQDWATHAIGHQLTALYGLDHAQTLAIVLPALLKNQFENKKQRLAHYAKAVFKLNYATETKLAKAAIDKTEKFFRSLGCKTRLNEYGIPKKDLKKIASKVIETSAENKLGEKKSIGHKDIIEILELAYLNNS